MKWEYKIIEQWMDEYEMNPLGNEGWNLMEVLRPTPDSLPWYIFKRPKEKDIMQQLGERDAKEQPCTCGLDESKGNYARIDIVCPKHDA